MGSGSPMSIVFEIYPTGNEDTSPTISGKFGKSTTQKCPKGWDGICSQKGWDLTIDSESLVWMLVLRDIACTVFRFLGCTLYCILVVFLVFVSCCDS